VEHTATERDRPSVDRSASLIATAPLWWLEPGAAIAEDGMPREQVHGHEETSVGKEKRPANSAEHYNLVEWLATKKTRAAKEDALRQEGKEM